MQACANSSLQVLWQWNFQGVGIAENEVKGFSLMTGMYIVGSSASTVAYLSIQLERLRARETC